jgi:DNA-binding IclR family transcriptional regulator
VAGLAAPVYDCDGLVCAALNIAGPKQRFADDRRQKMLAQLLAAAQELSTLLGNRGRA